VVDFDGVRLAGLLRRMERDDLAIARIRGQVVGEGGDAAVAGWICRNEGSANDDEAPLGRLRARQGSGSAGAAVHDGRTGTSQDRVSDLTRLAWARHGGGPS
jgi:hypothetical protein